MDPSKRINCAIAAIMAVLCILLLYTPSSASNLAIGEDNAVIIAYNYIENPIDIENSITIEQFKNHIKEIERSRYKTISLEGVINRLKKAEFLNDKTISIIFNEFNAATLKKALPILKEADLPFTVFYAADKVKDKAFLKELRDNDLVTLAILPANEQPLVEANDINIAKNINKAIKYHQDLTKDRPIFFKYPEGEYSNKIIDIISSYKFLGAISENIGAISSKSNFNLLSSVNITREFGDLDLFITSLNTKFLDYTDILPQDNLINGRRPIIGFTLKDEKINDSDISCYASDIGKLKTVVIDNKRVEIRLNQPLIYRKTSINCTILVQNKNPDDKSWKSFSTTLIKKGEK